VNVFLDSSVLLAACGSAAGASRSVIDAASAQGWSLLTSSYVLAEVETNLAALPAGSPDAWVLLRAKLEAVPDVLTFDGQRCLRRHATGRSCLRPRRGPMFC